jgi:hypothetical protein
MKSESGTQAKAYAAARESREALALRENLRRRKAQQQNRTSSTSETREE